MSRFRIAEIKGLPVRERDQGNYLVLVSIRAELHFPSELQALTTTHSIPKSSTLRSLHPFLGEELIRLGGRLKNSKLNYNERHPIILPKHIVTELLIDRAHKATLHGGTQLTLRHLRQNYWIISARTSVKSYIHNCVRCARESASISQQLMGNLPRPRVTPSAPFTYVGVDYAITYEYFFDREAGPVGAKVLRRRFICLLYVSRPKRFTWST